MCGIFGYQGQRDAVQIVIEGLKKLEYRGYDSAGLAGIHEGNIVYCKEVGKVSALEKEAKALNVELHTAIAQTRWATHGKPSKVNAHPHFDSLYSVAIVHNGIIENADELRKSLREKGVLFVSQTDTEAVAHLIADLYEGDLLQAIVKTMAQLKGSFAIAIIHKDFPDQIIAIAHECPLVLGIGEGELFISSDPHAFSTYTKKVIYLENSEIALIKSGNVTVFNRSLQQLSKEVETLSAVHEDASKGNFEHFTLKEIHEQPKTIRQAMSSRLDEEYGTATFEDFSFDVNELLGVQRILVLACGTSWHAGYVASYLIEEIARIPVEVEISSEFRYKNPVVPPGTFVIAISQSGETADTLASVRELKAKGAKVLAICNVQGTSLTREADCSIFLRAGPEIGVCSTKAFTSQIIVLALFGLMMARMRHFSKQEGRHFLQGLQELPEKAQQVLDNSHHIEAIAKKYAKFDNFFFLGRSYMFPTSLEGALKLKEISYINANGYPAGEMKHGPIALINETCPTVALCCNKSTFEKLLSNLMEVKARGGKIIAIVEEEEDRIREVADEIIVVPPTTDPLAVIPTTIVTQLLAYYIAKERGADIDHPRNLAKSVTVE